MHLLLFSLGKMKVGMCYTIPSPIPFYLEEKSTPAKVVQCPGLFNSLLIVSLNPFHVLPLVCVIPCKPTRMVGLSLDGIPEQICHGDILLGTRETVEECKPSLNASSHHCGSQQDMQVLDLWIKYGEIHSQICQVTCIACKMQRVCLLHSVHPKPGL